MSLYDYQKSKEISAEDPSFASLIMAAALKADTLNFGRLRSAFPEIIEELEKRYFKGGVLSRGHQSRVAGISLRKSGFPSHGVLLMNLIKPRAVSSKVSGACLRRFFSSH